MVYKVETNIGNLITEIEKTDIQGVLEEIQEQHGVTAKDITSVTSIHSGDKADIKNDIIDRFHTLKTLSESGTSIMDSVGNPGDDHITNTYALVGLIQEKAEEIKSLLFAVEPQ